MRLVVRVCVEVDAQDDADALCERIKLALVSIGHLRLMAAKPYWKITEYFELLLEFEDLRCEAPEQVAQTALGAGWLPAGECALWNPGPDSTFIVDEARWASVELVALSSYSSQET